MMEYLPTAEVEPKQAAKASVIWLHGLGADGHDFEAIVPELHLPDDLAIRFVFPHAPKIPVTINNGYVMPAWYNILDMSIERNVDVAQLEHSSQAIAALIDREIERGVPAEKIILAGFSQGGAVAYQCGLTYPKPLAGILALSTYFATATSIETHAANDNIPVYIFHGTKDPVVPEFLGQQARDLLKHMGYKCRYQTYPMEHSVVREEIADLASVIQTCLA